MIIYQFKYTVVYRSDSEVHLIATGIFLLVNIVMSLLGVIPWFRIKKVWNGFINQGHTKAINPALPDRDWIHIVYILFLC